MSQPSIRFAEFELDIESCELRRAGRPLRLERIPMELLILLLQNPGKLVRRQTIEQELWGGGGFLETEHSINTAVNKLRATLRDNSRDPRFIRTVIGEGYRFIAEVKVAEPVDAPPTVSSPPPSAPDPPLAGPLAQALSGSKAENAPTGTSVAAHGAALSSQVVASVPDVSHPAQVDKPRRLSGKWFLAGAVVALSAVLLAWIAIHLLSAPKDAPRTPVLKSEFDSIAVLPFRDLAQNADQSYLAAGMTDQLISDLAISTKLRVISHQSVMQYKDAQLSLPEIARALNVNTIVEGSYLRQGNEILIAAQLLDAQNDRHLWAQSYRESDKDVLAMQDHVAHDIARQVALALGTPYARPTLQTVNETARNAYLRGRYLWNERTASGLIKSIRYYTDAIRADRNYAEAYAALSQSYLALSTYDARNPADALLKAQFAAERAIDLDSNLSSAHTALAGVKIEQDWDWEGAEEEYRRAIAINPSDSIAHHWYGLHLIRMGRSQEGLNELKRALASDPLSLIIGTDLAESYYLLRRSDAAMAQVNEVLALNPNFAQAHLVKAKILAQLGRYSDAEKEFAVSDRLFDGDTWPGMAQAYLSALPAKRAEAIQIVRELESPSAARYITGVHMAALYCALGQPDNAMQWLQRAYQRHDPGIDMLGVEPLFDNCRSDTRFQELLLRLKLKAP